MPLSPRPGSPIEPFLKHQGFVVLDGGLATELENRGHRLDTNLWSARLLLERPQAIRNVHLAYLEAGADCVITATYQASIPGFLAAGLSEKKATSLFHTAVELATEARAQYLETRMEADYAKPQPLIAASIGPFGAFLADGSEYRGDYGVPTQELRAFHEPRWAALRNAPADLFAIETIPSFQEATVLLDLLNATPDVYAWISFSCMDGLRISDGTPIAECAALFDGCDQVVAIGVNCTAPRHIASLIGEVRKGAPAQPVVVYPNAGEMYDGDEKCWVGTDEEVDFGSAAMAWYQRGARLLGGCCRTSPRQIGAMREALSSLSLSVDT